MDSRIYLEKFSSDNKKTITKWMTPLLLSKDETKYFMCERVKSEKDVAKWVSRRVKRWNITGFSWYTIMLHSGEFIGGIYSDIDDSETCIVTGFILLKQYWGNGYAEEAFYLMMRELDSKGTLDDKRTCWTTVYPENVRSIKLLEKLGFTREVKPCDVIKSSYRKFRLVYVYNDISIGNIGSQNKDFLDKLRTKYSQYFGKK